MARTNKVLLLCALLCAGAAPPAGAQAVYKCGAGRNTAYTQAPCSAKAVNTDDAPVPPRANRRETDVRRLEHNRAVARSLRKMPGETVAQFDKRRYRAGMLETDRDECARLDKRIPFEKARLTEPDAQRVQDAQEALKASTRRYSQLRC